MRISLKQIRNDRLKNIYKFRNVVTHGNESRNVFTGGNPSVFNNVPLRFDFKRIHDWPFPLKFSLPNFWRFRSKPISLCRSSGIPRLPTLRAQCQEPSSPLSTLVDLIKKYLRTRSRVSCFHDLLVPSIKGKLPQPGLITGLHLIN